MSHAEPDQVVYAYARSRSELRATLTSFKGRRFCHLREYVAARESGDMIPTQKGIALPIEDLCELEAAVAALRAAVGPEEGD